MLRTPTPPCYNHSHRPAIPLQSITSPTLSNDPASFSSTPDRTPSPMPEMNANLRPQGYGALQVQEMPPVQPLKLDAVPVRNAELDGTQSGGSKGSSNSFASNLTGPTTQIQIGRAHNQTTYIIHTRILTGHHNSNSSSGQSTTPLGLSTLVLPAPPPPLFAPRSSVNSAPEEILTVKDTDPATFSSVLEFLYTGDYTPTLALLELASIRPDVATNPLVAGPRSKAMFTVAALLAHLRAGVFARKQGLERLVRIVQEKLRVTVSRLDSVSLLEVIKILYADGYTFREEFFRLIGRGQEGPEVKSKDSGDEQRGVRAFWNKDVLGRLMGGEVREDFLDLMGKGGTLARDVAGAMWGVQLGN